MITTRCGLVQCSRYGRSASASILKPPFNWNHAWVIAGLTRTNYLFRLHEGTIKKEEIVEFLKVLEAHLKQPLQVIWDGLRGMALT